MPNTENTMAPLEEEERDNAPPLLRFEPPSSEAPLNSDAEVQTEASRRMGISGMHIAVLVATDVEEAEIVDTTAALRDAGARVDIVSVGGREVQLMRHDDKTKTLAADRSLDSAHASEYDGMLLPGGTINADQLRMQEKAREFVKALDADGKPIAAICHAPWLLVSAGLVGDRTLTSYYTLQDDVRNAGGRWLDQEVVVDDNWVTSRSPSDIPAFNREMIRLFGECRAA